MTKTRATLLRRCLHKASHPSVAYKRPSFTATNSRIRNWIGANGPKRGNSHVRVGGNGGFVPFTSSYTIRG